jgi:hypothetical protein
MKHSLSILSAVVLLPLLSLAETSSAYAASEYAASENAKDQTSVAPANPDADRQVAEMAVDLQNEISNTFESTLPCDLRPPMQKKAQKEIEDITPKSKIPLFQSREIADMEFDADFKKVMAGTKEDAAISGTIRYRLKNGKEVSVPVAINVRGHSKQSICKDFKPLMLHFKKEDTQGTVFEHIGDHVKLATHCSGMGSHKITEANSQLVVRESAAYQILEDNGLLGYKTRLAHMKYRDNNGNPVAEGISFFLEPDSKMAERWGYKKSKDGDDFNKIQRPGRVDYLLGSELVGAIDQWAGHNTTALLKEGQPAAMALYDLDMSLLTNPSLYLRWNENKLTTPQNDIQALQDFIQFHPDGAEAAKAFLDRALSRKEHTMSIVDQLPIQQTKFIKDRLEMWYGAIQSVIQGKPAPAPLQVPRNIPEGTYRGYN